MQSESKFVKQTAQALLLSLITFFICFRLYISYNETDVIPYAKSFYNGSWLERDWYLNLKIQYRFLFSWITGYFSDRFGITETIIIGRLLSYVFFSAVYLKIAKTIGLQFITTLLSFIIFLIFFRESIFATEWMVGGFETKVFSYAFALLSLAAFIDKKYRSGLLFAGLSLSFHILIGFYNLICLIPVIVLEQSRDKNHFLKIIKSSYLFFISGIIGFYGIYTQPAQGLDSEIVVKGWEIYVNIRVPHHTNPHFSNTTYLVLAVFTVANLLFLRSKRTAIKSLSLYSLFSVLILIVGLFVSRFGDSQYLRFYFFRFCAEIQPLITILLLSSIFPVGFFKVPIKKLKPGISYLLAIFAVAIILFFTVPSDQLNPFFKSSNYNIENIKNANSPDIAMMEWIKQNTSENAVFIVNPDYQYFYIHAERAILALWKHVPQSPREIIEWHNRLKMLNRNKDFKNRSDLVANYPSLTTEEVMKIIEVYPEVVFILMPHDSQINLPIAHETAKYKLFYIKNSKS